LIRRGGARFGAAAFIAMIEFCDFLEHGCRMCGSATRKRNYDGSPPQGPSRGTAGQFVCFPKCSR